MLDGDGKTKEEGVCLRPGFSDKTSRDTIPANVRSYDEASEPIYDSLKDRLTFLRIIPRTGFGY